MRLIPKEYFTEFDGVDAKTQVDVVQKYRSDKDSLRLISRVMNNGEIACSLSHLQVMEQALSKDFEYAVIFEDDAIFSTEFNVLKELVDKIPSGADLVYLYSGKQDRLKRPINYSSLFWAFRENPIGSWAYVISKKAMQQYVDYSKEKICIPVDECFRWNLKSTYRLAEPIVTLDQSAESFLEGVRATQNKKSNLYFGHLFKEFSRQHPFKAVLVVVLTVGARVFERLSDFFLGLKNVAKEEVK